MPKGTHTTGLNALAVVCGVVVCSVVVDGVVVDVDVCGGLFLVESANGGGILVAPFM